MGDKKPATQSAATDAENDDELENEPGNENDAENENEPGNEADKDKDGDEGFEGEFDPKRARRTIDRLRNELRETKAAKTAPKPTEETKRLSNENLRLRVALKAGLDDDLADRLKGETEEELLADAQKLLDKFYPEQEKKPLTTSQPKADLKGGTKANEDPELTAEQLVDKALGR